LTEGRLVGAEADTETVRNRQYRDSANLKRRANIHKYGRSPIGWFNWIAQNARLPADASVLDIGCGPGWLWANAAADFPPGLALTLADISSGMVGEAVQAVSPVPNYRSVTGAEANIIDLPFENSSFEAVLACHMLYHVPDLERAMAEMIRVLKPGGALIVTTNGKDNMAELYAAGGAAFGGYTSDPSSVNFDIGTAKSAFSARLDDVQVIEFRDELHITDGEDIVGTLTSYPPGSNATDAQVETLRRIVAARMEANSGVFRTDKLQGLIRGTKRA
jgi:SAM-dependent methyltransferase